MNTYPTTIKQLNKFIQAKYPGLEVVKHHDTLGSFYWHSDNEELSVHIAGLYSSTVEGVVKITQQSFDRWMDEADEIMHGFRYPETGEVEKVIGTMTREELELAYYHQVRLRASEAYNEMLIIVKDDKVSCKRAVKNGERVNHKD
jgi:hypothetical protein